MSFLATGHFYNAILVEQNHYLPVFSEEFYIKSEEINANIVKDISYKSLQNVMLVLNVEDYRHLILTIAEVNHNNMEELCFQLKNSLTKETKYDFSVLILSERIRLEESIPIYHTMKKIINQKYFMQSSGVINFMFFHEKSVQLQEFNVDVIDNALERVDFANIYYEMDQRFAQIVYHMDYECFCITTRQFLDVLKKWDKRLLNLKTGEIFQVYKNGEEKNWFSVFDALIWMKRKYQQMEEILLYNKEQNYSREVIHVIRFICQHYKEADLNSSEIAECVEMNENRLKTVFKEEVGSTISQFLMDYRVTKAKELLRENKTKISGIHELIGYKTPQYFSRVFKNVSCMTPMEYKKLSNKV